MTHAIQPLQGPAGQIYDWLLRHRSVTPWHSLVGSLMTINALAGCRYLWGSTTVSFVVGMTDGEHTQGSAAACHAAIVRLLGHLGIASCNGLNNIPDHHRGTLVTDQRTKHHAAPTGQQFISYEPAYVDSRPEGERPVPDSLLLACRTIQQTPGGITVRADDFNRHLLQQLDDLDFDVGAAMASCLLAINRNPLAPEIINRDTRTALTLYGIRSGNFEALQDLCERLRDMDALAAVQR